MNAPQANLHVDVFALSLSLFLFANQSPASFILSFRTSFTLLYISLDSFLIFVICACDEIKSVTLEVTLQRDWYGSFSSRKPHREKSESVCVCVFEFS